MANKHFNSYNDLERYLKKIVRQTLEDDVNKEVRKTLKEHVVTDIYEKYSPSLYQRTGGLYQNENIESRMIDDETLSVRSTRSENGRDIAKVIEYGTGYTWEDSRIYQWQPYPRPFHENTAEELRDTGRAKEAMKRGLKKRGINTVN